PMTCAGLLGLAVVSGSKAERSMRSKGTFGAGGKFEKKSTEDAGPAPAMPNIAGDANIQSGLRYLAAALRADGHAGGDQGGPGGGIPTGGGVLPGSSDALHTNMYFLWSLERTCMVYGLSKLGDIDWHDWGAKHLLNSQMADGSWQSMSGHYSSRGVDTAFGLMFMCRANLVRDLSKILDRSMTNKNDPKAVAGAGGKKPDVKAPTDPVEGEAGQLAPEPIKARAAEQPA